MTTTVTMLQTRQGEGGSLWTVGNSYAASDAFATVLINSNYATGTLPKSRGLVPVNAQTDSNGQITALVDGAGNNYTLSQDRTSTVMPVEKVSLTASGSPCGAPCLLHRIRCLVGTAVSLVVYDNPFGTSGTQLYSGTLSAGQEAVIPTPVRAINGPRGVFTGTATFEYHVSQEA